MPVVGCSSVTEARAALGGAAVIVAVPVYDAWDDVVQCLDALLQHTSLDTPVLIVDDGSTDARVAGLPDRLRAVDHRVVILRHQANQGFVRSVNDAFAAAGRADVVILNSDALVGPEWLERLHAAACSDSRIATATPLTNHGTIVSVPYRNTPSELPAGLTPVQAARAVAARSSRLRPHLPTCVGHCTYVRRMALDLVGGFDETFSPGYAEEVDFSQRCTLAGLAHVCADDVFVYHRGSGSFGRSPEARRLQEEHEEIIRRRYPFYHPWIGGAANGQGGALGLAVAEARQALLGLRVVVDGTCLGPVMMGTQRAVLETIRALARHPGVAHVTAVVPEPHPAYCTGALAGFDKLELVADGPRAATLRADIAYRPVQLYSLTDLERLRTWGEKVVLSQLDLIAFNNPGYFPDWNVWAHYRDITRLALAQADAVAFLSEHAEREAREAGLVAPGQPTAVVHCGTDHFTLPTPVAPASLPADLVARGYVLCFGTDYRHKNRLFTLRVFERLVARGWGGYLVLAGPRVEQGSSRADEAAFLLERRALAPRIVSLAHVSEEERAWLYGHAGLVLHPSLYEGFGLVPFEAARAGAPCLAAPCASLAEMLPPDAEILVDWDPDAVAAQVLTLLTDPARRARLVTALARQADAFTWERTAAALVDLFARAVRTLRGPTITAVEGERGIVGTAANVPAATPLHVLLDESYPPEFQEALRAIGQRPGLRRPLVAMTQLGYRLASAVRSRLARQRPTS